MGWLMGETLAWSSGSRRSGGAAPMSGKRCLNLSSSAQGVAGQGVGTRFHPKQELAPNIVSPARARALHARIAGGTAGALEGGLAGQLGGRNSTRSSSARQSGSAVIVSGS